MADSLYGPRNLIQNGYYDQKWIENFHGTSGLAHVQNFTFISRLLLLLIAIIHVSQFNDICKRASKV